MRRYCWSTGLVKAISKSYRSSITSNCFDIYTFLMCQGERKEPPKIFHENIAGNWPDKKTMSTYLMVLSYSSTASIGKGKNPGKRLIWNNLVVFTLSAVSYNFQSWPFSYSIPLPYKYTPWVKLRGSNSELSLWLKTQGAIIQIRAIEHYMLLSSSTVYQPYIVVLTFTPVCNHSNETYCSTFMWHCLLRCTRLSYPKSVNETLVCDYSNESYRAILSCDFVCSSILWKFQIRCVSF